MLMRMAPRIVNGLEAAKSLAGEHLGYSPYIEITQERVNQFAEATGDHQWIHVDVERAAQGPFGGPIAHGYLTLALGPALYPQIVRFEGFSMGVNYGANKIRFPSPVPVDSRIRATATLREVADIPIGTQVVISFVIEREGGEKPACIADVVYVMAA
jgi:acyl dehydratase